MNKHLMINRYAKKASLTTTKTIEIKVKDLITLCDWSRAYLVMDKALGTGTWIKVDRGDE